MHIGKFRFANLLLVTFLVIPLTFAFTQSAVGNVIFNIQEPSAEVAPEGVDSVKAYLPIIRKGLSSLAFAGVETLASHDPNLMDKAKEARIGLVRVAAFNWELIEPNPPVGSTHNYDWTAVNEAGFLEMTNRGMEIIATIQIFPDWATTESGKNCGPVDQDRLDEFTEFIKQAVARYSVSPYNVRYYEIGNEPDVDPREASMDIFGCWGNKDDPYYGGGYYASMLKQVYPAIKSVNPTAKVLIGGLLLDCDPTNPPAGKTCVSSKFLEGILINGGANYFDYVSFHGYPLYNGTLAGDEQHLAWGHRGGVVLGKVDFLREVMANYGVTKPIMHTEGSLLCPENYGGCNPPNSAFYEKQADYVVWLFVRNWAADIKGTIWYTLEGPGWRYGGLLYDWDGNPKPAYNVYKYLTEILADTNYAGPVTQYPDPNLRAYEFIGGGKKIWVIWAADELNHTIQLPGNLIGAYNKYGTLITSQPTTITVNSPVYIKLNP